jgi:hypothetical protein
VTGLAAPAFGPQRPLQESHDPAAAGRALIGNLIRPKREKAQQCAGV